MKVKTNKLQIVEIRSSTTIISRQTDEQKCME